MTDRIGFAGIGIMGSGMASNLIAKGHPLIVWNRTRAKAEAIRDAAVADTLEDLAAAVDDLWSTAGNKPIDRQNLQYMSARVGRDQVTQAGGVIASLDDDGEFVLSAKEGEHLLCHLEQGESGREWARGCGFLTLPASGELEITDGEGGFSVGMKE